MRLGTEVSDSGVRAMGVTKRCPSPTLRIGSAALGPADPKTSQRANLDLAPIVSGTYVVS